MSRKIVIFAVLGLLILLTVLTLIFTGVLGAHRVRRGVTLEGVAVGGMKRAHLEDLVRELARDIQRPPRNAYADPGSGTYVAEVTGLQVDVEATVEAVMQAPPHSM